MFSFKVAGKCRRIPRQRVVTECPIRPTALYNYTVATCLVLTRLLFRYMWYAILTLHSSTSTIKLSIEWKNIHLKKQGTIISYEEIMNFKEMIILYIACVTYGKLNTKTIFLFSLGLSRIKHIWLWWLPMFSLVSKDSSFIPRFQCKMTVLCSIRL